MGEGREGVLVRVLVGVLVLMLMLMLVLVELCAQVRWGAQRGTAVGALGGQETGVELLAQKVLLCRGKERESQSESIFPIFLTPTLCHFG